MWHKSRLSIGKNSGFILHLKPYYFVRLFYFLTTKILLMEKKLSLLQLLFVIFMVLNLMGFKPFASWEVWEIMGLILLDILIYIIKFFWNGLDLTGVLQGELDRIKYEKLILGREIRKAKLELKKQKELSKLKKQN